MAHLTGCGWTVEPLLAFSSVHDLDGRRPHEVWAVGSEPQSWHVTFRWNGTRSRDVESRGPASYITIAVAADGIPWAATRDSIARWTTDSSGT